MSVNKKSNVESAGRSVPQTFTGWRIYSKSDREEDALALCRDVKGSGWYFEKDDDARESLSFSDFHVYFEGGKPLVSIRVHDGSLIGYPMGRHAIRPCSVREDMLAFDHVLESGIRTSESYLADMKDIRRVMSPEATWKDAFEMPHRRRCYYAYVSDGYNWGDEVDGRVAELMSGVSVKERHAAGYFLLHEVVADTNNNGYPTVFSNDDLEGVKVLKGNVDLNFDTRICSVFRTVEKIIVPDVFVSNACRLLFPELKIVDGSFYIFGDSSDVYANALQSVRGSLSVCDDSRMHVRALQRVGGDLSVRRGFLYARVLQNVGGNLEVEGLEGLVKFPSLREVEGNFVYSSQIDEVDLSALQVVGGNFKYLSEHHSLSLPALEYVGKDFYVSADHVEAPVLRMVGGNTTVWASLVADSLRRVGQDVAVCKDAVMVANALQDVGSLQVHESAKVTAPGLGYHGPDIKRSQRQMKM